MLFELIIKNLFVWYYYDNLDLKIEFTKFKAKEITIYLFLFIYSYNFLSIIFN